MLGGENVRGSGHGPGTQLSKITDSSCKLANTALWKNVLSKGRNLHGCKAIKCEIPCIDCKAVKLSFLCGFAIHARQFTKKCLL